MKKCNITWYVITIILLALLLWVNIYNVSNSNKGKASGKDAWDLEIMKVGWEENWEQIEKIYKSKSYIDQQTQAIDATIAEFEWNNQYGEEWDTATQWNEDVSAIVENLLATAPVRGDKNARFTIIEYTELLCPFCQRHSTNWTIEAVMDQFPGEINSISRHYIIHWQTALELAAAMECVSELKPEVYYDVFKKAFEAYPVDMDTLKNIASELWVNWNNLQTCIDEWRYTQSVQNMMNQGASVFGITGTPGNVIYDRETWKYKVLPWAYPAENFVEIINELKSN